MPYNVTVDDISPLITYEGRWKDSFNLTSDSYTNRYLGSTFHSSSMNGAEASFRFNGTAVYIFGAKRTNHGSYTVQLDDEQPQPFDGLAPDGMDRIFQVALYARTDLPNGLHKVVLTNQPEVNRSFVDIDFVTWTSNDEAYTNKTLDDGQFDYSDEWSNTSPYAMDYYGRTEHVTNRGGASASLSFEGTAIYLYGGTLPNHGAFTVQLNDHQPVVLNGSTNDYHSRVLLFYADGLGAGAHKLTITNTDTKGGYLDIDYIDVVQPSPTPITNYTPLVVGIVCGVVAVIALSAAAVWHLARRKKHRSALVDLVVDDDPRIDQAAPPIGYGPLVGGPGLNRLNSLQFQKVPRAPQRNMKGCQLVIQTTEARGTRDDDELLVMRQHIPSQPQSQSGSNGISSSEITDMLPPEYHQVIERLASYQQE